MCRFAAYLGAPVAPAALLYDAPHSLERQAYAPAEQLSGTINVDGTGVAWWPDDGGGPVRHATTLPPWSDENLAGLAGRLRSRSLVAAVRGATPGAPHGRDAVAPMLVDGLAIAHNGWIGGFPDRVATRLLRELSDERLAALRLLGDSQVVALTIADSRAPGRDLAGAVETGLRRVVAAVRAAGETATLNLVVADGQRLVGVRLSVDEAVNSLYVLADGHPPWAGGTLLASEPLDDGDWRAVAEHHLVEVADDTVRTTPLDLDDLGATA